MIDGDKIEEIALRADTACDTPCFEVSDLRIVTHRVIGGIPVNDDGGTAVRTKQ